MVTVMDPLELIADEMTDGMYCKVNHPDLGEIVYQRGVGNCSGCGESLNGRFHPNTANVIYCSSGCANYFNED